jgi:hypothetical protein
MWVAIEGRAGAWVSTRIEATSDKAQKERREDIGVCIEPDV